MSNQVIEFSKLIAEVTRRSVKDIRDERTLRELVHDSFALVEMMVDLQERFEIELKQEDFAGVVTIGDLKTLVRSRAKAAIV